MAKRREVPEYIHQEDFLVAKDKIIGKAHNTQGIGTLSEKTVHAVLKNFVEPDLDQQEVALDGYFADIYHNGEVVEIQTRQFNKLREKLAVFLNHYPVTVIYPIPYYKWLSWIDEKSGEMSEARLSPRHMNEYDAFFELYKIKMHLKNPNLRIHLYLMDMEEYKLLNGWDKTKKHGAWRYDRIPLGIRKIVTIDQPEDYLQFVPVELEGQWTSADFAKAAKIPKAKATNVLGLLYYMGAVQRVGKKGNSYLYEVGDE